MKTVHWQLPFCSLKGTQYRIDIYADGAVTAPVQLTGAATPFTTDEDNSDDFFAPVRTQTGSITVVDTTGTLMADLMPSDNIDRPVRLIRVSDGAIMWHGFLSCEAYSQPYTSRPTEITLPVNSVLAAMDSVKMEQSMSGFVTVGSLINDILGYMADLHAQVNHYYLPMSDIDILAKYIDTTVMFDSKEQSNENSVIYTLVGVSLREVLSRLCTFMGWTLREQGDTIYFASKSAVYLCYDHIGTVRPDGTVSHTYRQSATTRQPTSTQMSAFDYRGTGHQVEQRQGAKSVDVVAQLDSIKLDVSLQECPTDEVEVYECDQLNKHTYSIVNQNWQFNSHNRFNIVGVMYAFVFVTRSVGDDYPVGGTGTEQAFVMTQDIEEWPQYKNNITLRYGKDSEYSTRWNAPEHQYGGGGDMLSFSPDRMDFAYINDGNMCGAFMTKVELMEKGDERTAHRPTSGLYLSGFPVYKGGNQMVSWKEKGTSVGYHNLQRSVPVTQTYQPLTEALYCFRMDSVNYISVSRGWLNIDGRVGFTVTNDGNIHTEHFGGVKFTAALCLGDKYWNGQEWVSEFATFRIELNDEGSILTNYDEKEMDTDKTDGLFIPLEDKMYGLVSLMLYHEVESGEHAYCTKDIFFTDLSVEYCDVVTSLYNNRSANHYFQLLGLNFSDEVTVNTDLASDLNNRPSPSILMNSETEPMTTLTYADGTTERPERHLLSRLATYYGQVRQRITLEADRPTTPLPLTRITGYPDAEGNTKTYLPLSESRDWHTDTSTITCFETPE